MTDVIGFPRWTADIAWSGGSWTPEYPRTNLGTLPLARVARTASVEPAATRWEGRFSRSRRVDVIALCRHNLTLAAQWRFRLFAEVADVAPLYDSGLLDVWPPVYTEDEATWDSGNWWDLKYSDEDIAGYAWNAPLFVPGELAGERFTVEVFDPAHPAGYLQFGLCEVAQALAFPVGTAFGAQVGFASRTGVIEADGGVEYFEPRDKPRTFAGAIPALKRSQALATVYELQRTHDVHTPFFWWPTREEARHALRTAFLARMSALDPLVQAYTGHDQISLSLREVL